MKIPQKDHMGRFIYENSIRVEFEDRLLSHLQIVFGNKLRRGEPFFFTWKDGHGNGARTSVWVHPRASLAFQSSGSRAPSTNRAWLDVLMASANAPTGLRIVAEPVDDGAPPLTG